MFLICPLLFGLTFQFLFLHSIPLPTEDFASVLCPSCHYNFCLLNINLFFKTLYKNDHFIFPHLTIHLRMVLLLQFLCATTLFIRVFCIIILPPLPISWDLEGRGSTLLLFTVLKEPSKSHCTQLKLNKDC